MGLGQFFREVFTILINFVIKLYNYLYVYEKNYKKNSAIYKELSKNSTISSSSASFDQNETPFNLIVTSPNGQSAYFTCTLSDLEKMLKALQMKPHEIERYYWEIMSWAARLAILLEVTTIDDYIDCVKLITCRYDTWESKFCLDYEEILKRYVDEIKALKGQYEEDRKSVV